MRSTDRDVTEITLSGRLFQTVGPATGKARRHGPKAKMLYLGFVETHVHAVDSQKVIICTSSSNKVNKNNTEIANWYTTTNSVDKITHTLSCVLRSRSRVSDSIVMTSPVMTSPPL